MINPNELIDLIKKNILADNKPFLNADEIILRINDVQSATNKKIRKMRMLKEFKYDCIFRFMEFLCATREEKLEFAERLKKETK